MTEDEWATSKDPDEMLVVLEKRASDRKLRLFCCACVRRVWDRLAGSKASRHAVEMAEAFADGRLATEEMEAAAREAQAVIDDASRPVQKNARRAAGWCANAAMDAPGIAKSVAWGAAYARPRPRGSERIAQAHLLREIFNPYLDRPGKSPLSNHGGSSVLKMAHAAYEERDLPTGLLLNTHFVALADLLERSGCTDAGILAHCRQPGPHVRGCWVLDVLLKRK